MHSNKVEVLSRDVVVVLFHLAESILVVLHQVVNVLVLTLFDLVNLNFGAKLEVPLERGKLNLILFNQRLFLHVEALSKVGKLSV